MLLIIIIDAACRMLMRVRARDIDARAIDDTPLMLPLTCRRCCYVAYASSAFTLAICAIARERYDGAHEMREARDGGGSHYSAPPLLVAALRDRDVYERRALPRTSHRHYATPLRCRCCYESLLFSPPPVDIRRRRHAAMP